MPTDKHRIAAYVPRAVYVRFEIFKQERLLNDSQAINAILTEFLGVNPDEARRELLTIDKLRSELFDVLDNAVMDIRSELLRELKSSLLNEPNSNSFSGSLNELESILSSESNLSSNNDLLSSSLSESSTNPSIKTTAATNENSQNIDITPVQLADLKKIHDRVGKVTKAKSKKLLDLGLIAQIGDDLILSKLGEAVLAKQAK
jgi:hypothetical protein